VPPGAPSEAGGSACTGGCACCASWSTFASGRAGKFFAAPESVGALNLALERFCDPEAEIVGVIDADYVVDPSYLRETAGYVAAPDIAFVRTPQDYRDWEGSACFTACYDAYRYFFATAMVSRNERNSITFAANPDHHGSAHPVRWVGEHQHHRARQRFDHLHVDTDGHLDHCPRLDDHHLGDDPTGP